MRPLRVLLVGCTLAACMMPGCGKDEDAPKYRRLTGRVASIDQASGVVEMLWYSEKQTKELRLSGKLAPDAEILIDGATARLEDIQIDDPVTVTGREEKHDGVRNLVATKVEVTRTETAETKPGQ